MEEKTDTVKPISLVVVAYNCLNYTVECINSILDTADVPFSLFIIDSGSSDGTYQYFNGFFNKYKDCRLLRGVYLKRLDKNKGFGYAVNTFLANNQFGDFVLINNDLVFKRKGWLSELCNEAQSDEKIGLVADKVCFKSFEHTFSEKYKWLKDVEMCGLGCTYVRRIVCNIIGHIDSTFKIGGWEDVDFILRSYLAGFKAKKLDLGVHHYGSVTYKQFGDNIRVGNYYINETYLCWKWFSVGVFATKPRYRLGVKSI